MKVETFMLANEICMNEIFANAQESDELKHYNKDTGDFRDDGKIFVRTYLEARYGGDISTHLINETIAHIQNRSMKSIEQFANLGSIRYGVDDPEDILINLPNGVFSIKQQKLLEHSPKYMFTSCLPFRYNKEAQCPKIFRFLKAVSQPYYDRFFTLCEMSAWTLIPKNKFQKMGLLWGPGENGKGIYLRLNTAILGKQNASSVTIQQLIGNRFMSAQLFKKMLNAAGDIPDKPLSDTGIIKQLSGEDLVTAEKKNGQPFQFSCDAKSIFSANKAPKTSDDTRAFYRRWIIVLFENIFSVENGLRDEGIFEKISTEEELAGYFNFMVEGFVPILMQRNGFTYGQTVEQIEALYTRLSDSAKVFIEKMLVQDLEAELYKDAIAARYEEFCMREGLLKESDKAFRNTLDRSGLIFEEHMKNSKRYYKGLKIREIGTDKDIEDAEKEYNRLVKKGYKAATKLFQRPGMKAGFVYDPDGIWIGVRSTK